jgi:SAM-dependent methyltransferase
MSNEKLEAEMSYWRERFKIEGVLGNGHYKDILLLISGKHESFFEGKIIADFGSGPRGSLEWATPVATCHCIDVLVEEYRALGIDNHRARYTASTEDEIPLPTGMFDVVFSLNSLDHATHWTKMMDECIRILKPGGLLAMSINIDEPPSPAEPNTLTVPEVLARLAGRAFVDRQMVSNRSKGTNKYEHLQEWSRNGTMPPPYNGSWGIMWFSATKF